MAFIFRRQHMFVQIGDKLLENCLLCSKMVVFKTHRFSQLSFSCIQLYLVLLHLFCIFIFEIQGEKLKPPKISLGSQADSLFYYGNKVQANITFFNETVAVVPESVPTVNFNCNATYPIVWNLLRSKV